MLEHYQVILIFIVGAIAGGFIGRALLQKDVDLDRVMKRSEKKTESFQIDDCDLDFFDHEGTRFVLVNKGKEFAIRQIK
jgi:uncharacterized protein YcfJ